MNPISEKILPKHFYCPTVQMTVVWPKFCLLEQVRVNSRDQFICTTLHCNGNQGVLLQWLCVCPIYLSSAFLCNILAHIPLSSTAACIPQQWPTSQTQPTNALRLLADASVKRHNELDIYPTSPQKSDSDEENNSQSPIFECSYEPCSPSSIHSMTNFDPEELQMIWNNFCDFILDKCNTGRGRKYLHSGREVLFMELTILKHGGE